MIKEYRIAQKYLSLYDPIFSGSVSFCLIDSGILKLQWNWQLRLVIYFIKQKTESFPLRNPLIQDDFYLEYLRSLDRNCPRLPDQSMSEWAKTSSQDADVFEMGRMMYFWKMEKHVIRAPFYRFIKKLESYRWIIQKKVATIINKFFQRNG